MSSLAALEVFKLIGEAMVSVANGYITATARLYKIIDDCFFVGAKGGELFSCPPRTGSSKYPLISLQLLVLSIVIVTHPL